MVRSHRRHLRKSGLNLTTRPFLPQNHRARASSDWKPALARIISAASSNRLGHDARMMPAEYVWPYSLSPKDAPGADAANAGNFRREVTKTKTIEEHTDALNRRLANTAIGWTASVALERAGMVRRAAVSAKIRSSRSRRGTPRSQLVFPASP
jgi:hypothetical protein